MVLCSNTLNAAVATVAEEGSLLDKILKEGRLAPTEEERETAKQWVEALVEQVVTKEMKVSPDTIAPCTREAGTTSPLHIRREASESTLTRSLKSCIPGRTRNGMRPLR